MGEKVLDRSQMLFEAGLALTSELSLDAVLQRIVELATGITGAKYGALGVLGPDGRISRFLTIGIDEVERHGIGALPVGRGLLGLLIREGRPYRVPEISRDPNSVGFPPNHPEMHSFLGAPVVARGKVFGNIYLTEKRGAAEFSQKDEENLVVLATQAGVAVENATLHEEALRREQRLEALREITDRMLDGSDPEDALELVAKAAVDLAGADLATVAVPVGDGEHLVIDVAVGEGAEQLQGTTFPIEGSLSGGVMRSGQVAVLTDAAGDERVYQPIAQGGRWGPSIFVPLSARGAAFGTLSISNLIGGEAFSEQQVEVVRTFAGQASVAIEYARARREVQRLLVMEDRERIAKELHDGAIQSLFAVGMGLQATATISKDPELARRIEGTVNEIDRVIRDLRNYIFGLRPGILADRQLDQALRELARDFEEKSGVTSVVDIDRDVAAEIGAGAGDVIQLIREALSNVSRHAHAATVRVSLRRREDGALIEIDDDGQGFDLADATGRGNGLRNLQERAASLGGTLDIDSVAGEGTTVRIELPM